MTRKEKKMIHDHIRKVISDKVKREYGAASVKVTYIKTNCRIFSDGSVFINWANATASFTDYRFVNGELESFTNKIKVSI